MPKQHKLSTTTTTEGNKLIDKNANFPLSNLVLFPPLRFYKFLPLERLVCTVLQQEDTFVKIFLRFFFSSYVKICLIKTITGTNDHPRWKCLEYQKLCINPVNEIVLLSAFFNALWAGATRAERNGNTNFFETRFLSLAKKKKRLRVALSFSL